MDWIAMLVAVAAAAFTGWQATIARRGAWLASRQANAAEVQAVDAQRAADAAQQQLKLAQVQFEQATREAELSRKIASYKALNVLAVTGMELGSTLDSLALAIDQKRLSKASGQESMRQFATSASKFFEAWFEYLPHSGASPFYDEVSKLVGFVSRLTFDPDKRMDEDGRQELATHARGVAKPVSQQSRRLAALARSWVLKLDTSMRNDEADKA